METYFFTGCAAYFLGFFLLLTDYRRQQEYAKLFRWGPIQFLADIALLFSASRFFEMYLLALKEGKIANHFLQGDAFTYFLFPVILGIAFFFLSRNYALAIHFSNIRGQTQ